MFRVKSFILFILFISSSALSAPLGTIPTIEEENLRLIFGFRSDIWTSPYRYKSAPIRIIDGSIKIPVAHGNSWKASLEMSYEDLGLGRADFTLGKKSVFIGSNLRSQSMGLGLSNELSDGSSTTFFAAYNSASDNPYDDPRDIWVESTAIYRSPLYTDHKWLLAVNYSNNRGFANGKLFPYFGLIYDQNPNFTAIWGFPFIHLTWKNPEAWRKEFRLTPFGINLDLQKEIEDEFTLSFFSGFNVRGYLHDERLEDSLRLYYQEGLVGTSLRRDLSPATQVTFSIGYSFDRRLYETHSIFSPNSEMTGIPNDLYGKIGVEFRL